MPEYQVTWTVELNADSPEEAAKLAREWQLDPNNEASCFVVKDPQGNEIWVDALEDDSDGEELYSKGVAK